MSNTKYKYIVVLGSQKCATTSLFYYLSQHKDIYSFLVEESCYFMGDLGEPYWNKKHSINYKKDQYFNYLISSYKGQEYILDEAPQYTTSNYQFKLNIPDNIYNECGGDVKFIFCIRNPFNRIISHILFEKENKGKDRRKIDECIKKVSLQEVSTSCYYTQIKPYMKKFNKDNFHFVIFEEFVKDTIGQTNKIFDFLGLDRFNIIPKIYNETNNKSSYTKDMLKFSENIYYQLRGFFENDVVLMSKVIGVDLLKCWDLSKETYCYK